MVMEFLTIERKSHYDVRSRGTNIFFDKRYKNNHVYHKSPKKQQKTFYKRVDIQF